MFDQLAQWLQPNQSPVFQHYFLSVLKWIMVFLVVEVLAWLLVRRALQHHRRRGLLLALYTGVSLALLAANYVVFLGSGLNAPPHHTTGMLVLAAYFINFASKLFALGVYVAWRVVVELLARFASSPAPGKRSKPGKPSSGPNGAPSGSKDANNPQPPSGPDQLTDPGRRVFAARLGLAAGALPAASLTWGVARGRYAYQVHAHELHFPRLPSAFDGFRLVQLSDLHAGSLDQVAAVARGLARAQSLNPDLLVFTGDLVNQWAEEFDPFLEAFRRLRAPYGKFAVRGNHDFGDYGWWPSPAERHAHNERLLGKLEQAGFTPLRNERVRLHKSGQHLELLGVDNWSLKGYKRYGCLAPALQDLQSEQFSILLSHDPSHWEAEARHVPAQLDLTLAGHTHGFQIGLETPQLRVSPAQLLFRHWAGLYWEGQQALYVNRGYGYNRYPGRLGILPEITLLVLRRARQAPMQS